MSCQNLVNKKEVNCLSYTLAGVYGSPEWKAKARLDPTVELAFDEVVQIREQNNY